MGFIIICITSLKCKHCETLRNNFLDDAVVGTVTTGDENTKSSSWGVSYFNRFLKIRNITKFIDIQVKGLSVDENINSSSEFFLDEKGVVSRRPLTEIIFPKLLDTYVERFPGYIVVEENSWVRFSKEKAMKECKAFYQSIESDEQDSATKGSPFFALVPGFKTLLLGYGPFGFSLYGPVKKRSPDDVVSPDTSILDKVIEEIEKITSSQSSSEDFFKIDSNLQKRLCIPHPESFAVKRFRENKCSVDMRSYFVE